MENHKIFFSHPVFPAPDIEKTAKYYHDILGFKVVRFLDAEEPHICLYRDLIEIILTKANSNRVYPNRELYGYGYDTYFITDNQESLQNEFLCKNANIVKPLFKVDYHTAEFVVEDIDGRWLGFGKKEDQIPTIK